MAWACLKMDGRVSRGNSDRQQRLVAISLGRALYYLRLPKMSSRINGNPCLRYVKVLYISHLYWTLCTVTWRGKAENANVIHVESFRIAR